MDRDKAIAAAIADGRIVPESRARWEKAWDENPKATAAVLKELAPGLTPEEWATLQSAAVVSAQHAEPLPSSWFRAPRRASGSSRASGAVGAASRPPSSAPPPSPSPAVKGEASPPLDWPEFKQVKSAKRGRVTFDQKYGPGD